MIGDSTQRLHYGHDVGAVDPVFTTAAPLPGALIGRPSPTEEAQLGIRVIGAGLGDRCAPAAVDHNHFAAAAPPGATHTVVTSMGHGDVLDDRPARAARLLCGGSADPGDERATVAELVTRFIEPD